MNSDDLYSQYLNLFESKEPLFYESPVFRQAFPELFRPSIEKKIGTVLWIPRGQRFENPEIDDLRDETIAVCQWKLSGYQIVYGDNELKQDNVVKQDNSAVSRYLNFRRFVLKTTTNVSIRYLRRKGRPWYHRDDERLSDQYSRNPTSFADGLDLQKNKRTFMELRECLGLKVKDLDFEMFRLRHEEGMRPREINQMYQELTVNLIRVKICRVKKALETLLRDPNVVRRLRGEEDDD